jgi:hypothetical protein
VTPTQTLSTPVEIDWNGLLRSRADRLKFGVAGQPNRHAIAIAAPHRTTHHTPHNHNLYNLSSLTTIHPSFALALLLTPRRTLSIRG